MRHPDTLVEQGFARWYRGRLIPVMRGGDGTDDDRPDWLPEKFKQPEELARAYGELEQRLGRAEQDSRAREEQLRNEFFQQLESMSQAAQQQARPDETQLQEQFLTDPLGLLNGLFEQRDRALREEIRREIGGAVNPMRETAQATAFTLATEALAARFDDWDEMRVKIGQELEQKPHLVPEAVQTNPVALAAALEDAYHLVRARETAAANGQQHTTSLGLAKRQAQTVTGTNGRPDTAGSLDDPEEYKKRARELHQGGGRWGV